MSQSAAVLAPVLVPPRGYKQIVNTFGNIADYIRDDGTLESRWEQEFLAHAALPFAIPLAGAPAKMVSRIYCHRKLTGIFADVFAAIHARGLAQSVTSYGGCFNYRRKRRGARFSTHCWGIAIDLNPETNAQGTPGDLNPALMAVFREFGFKWGGDWAGRARDPMHFQFCTAY